MKILITNDDGINARGIFELAKELSIHHEVLVVAPREQKSASSHSISIHSPIKVREENVEGLPCKCYSVLGTPADCTSVGMKLLGKDIDLVVSGINEGINIGTDIIYSGTVSAAVEAAIYDVPSIAVSQEVEWTKEGKEKQDYKYAAKVVKDIVDTAKDKFLRKNVVLNLNIPNCKESEVKGLKVCRIGKSTYDQEFILIEDNEDKVYQIKGKRIDHKETDSDVYYLNNKYITLTPLHFDLTSFDLIKEVENIFNY